MGNCLADCAKADRVERYVTVRDLPVGWGGRRVRSGSLSWLRHKSYDVLPALSVRKAELRRSLRLVTGAWALGIIWMMCTTGPWMNTFRRMLGFNNFHFGLMQALPFVAAFGNLAATIHIERTGLRKFHFILWGGISRLLWLVVLCRRCLRR